MKKTMMTMEASYVSLHVDVGLRHVDVSHPYDLMLVMSHHIGSDVSVFVYVHVHVHAHHVCVSGLSPVE